MLHDLHKTHPKTSVASTDVLGLIWLLAHSITLHDVMERMGKPISSQLRLKEMKAEVCLIDLESESVRCHAESYQSAWSIDWKVFFAQGLVELTQCL